MTAITAVANQKGGVGKTATALNVGAALAERGRSVALIDLDPQGHLTSALGQRYIEGEANLATALTGEWTGDLSELLVDCSPPATNGQNELSLWLLPTTPQMFVVARTLDQMRAREHRLARLLGQLDGRVDHVLIDCPPTLDILTDNALAAADGVLIPVQAEDSSLHALELLLAQISAVDEDLRDNRVHLHGLVVSMLRRPPSTLTKSTLEAYDELDLPVLATVPWSVKVGEAWRYGIPVTSHAPGSDQAEAYHSLAKTIDEHHTMTKETAR